MSVLLRYFFILRITSRDALRRMFPLPTLANYENSSALGSLLRIDGHLPQNVPNTKIGLPKVKIEHFVKILTGLLSLND